MLCLALSPVACKRGPADREPIVDIQIVDRTPAPSLLAKGELEKAVGPAIETHGFFGVRSAEPDEIGWQVTAVIERAVERSARPNESGVVPKDEAYREVVVSLRVRALSSTPPPGFDLAYESRAVIGRNSALFEPMLSVVTEGIREASRSIGVDIELSRVSDKELIEKIDHGDRLIRARAIAKARERKLSGAVPKLILLLESSEDDPEVVLETIGALIASRDQRAIGPLVESARRRSSQYLSQIIFGVAEIGGKEAEAYLFTVASGHRESQVRQHAKDALLELERRKSQQEKDTDG